MTIDPPEYSILILVKANTSDIISKNTRVTYRLPGGYRRFSDKFNPGITLYYWKYADSRRRASYTYGGLHFGNGHWFWIPEPWRFIKN
ncbi:hypothetical protein MNBD_GAMMA12-3940 [hydrothermal vent metagenome]|uniref:Uncharacterized protein n=1 Tax=hydrothermal vent metagenome TaxID=652676 RepID=A0A3B0YYM8_9ZZZZ